jgi:sigma-B regulation protein RsbU (phosphoserine phosphatase)
MSISDLISNLEEERDHILVVGPVEESKKRVLDILKRRNYRLSSLEVISEAREWSGDDVVDLVVIDEPDIIRSPDEIVAEIRAKTQLRRVPIVLLRPEICQFARVPESETRDYVVLLQSPPDPGLLLVKVATALRLWKIQAQQVKHESAVAAQNAQLRDLTNRFKRELKEAQEIQETILPSGLPADTRYRCEARYLPLEGVGGDFYDVWKIDEDRLGLFAGDVTGHGLPAALIGSMTKMALSNAAKDDVCTMLADMNDSLTPHMPSGRFLTGIAGIYDASRSELSVARAGHPPAFVWRRKTGIVERLQPKGLPLGIHEAIAFEGKKTVLEAGDRVFLVTDGLTESESMDGIQLGVEKTGELIARASSESPDLAAALARVLELRAEFGGGRIVKDDLTLVAFERMS